MTFIHPLLLGGLVLVGVPVLLHLMMRQKPKHLLFPAFRFLLLRHRTNQRRLQLRHLLLLALRMLIIAAICLALARPKVFSERMSIGENRAVAAVLVFDTRYSMQYTPSGGRSRLDEAKRRGQELLDDLPDGSRVAVLDTAEPGGGEWLPTLSLARERIARLELRPANHPVTGQLGWAYGLLAKLLQEQERPEEAPVPFLYVFSNRTRACWNSSQQENLQRLRDRIPPPGVNSVFVDVGVDKPEDLAITGVKIPQQSVPANKPVVLKVTVQATGTGCDSSLVCQIDNEKTPERKPVKLEAGEPPRTIAFERTLEKGQHQAKISLEPADGQLPFNNTAFASFEVREARRVLTITDEKQHARVWKDALTADSAFRCDLQSTSEAGELGLDELERYKVVCLLAVAKPTNDLWEKLKDYVSHGGGLAVIPGAELDTASYNEDKTAQGLLPGTFDRVIETADKNGVGWRWSDNVYQHTLLKPFREWNQDPGIDFAKFPRAATRYWAVQQQRGGARELIAYADDKGRPALLERQFKDPHVRGRVLLFTTKLDDSQPRWHNYEKLNSFYLVLAHRSMAYLAGDTEGGAFNHQSGETVLVDLPATARDPSYVIDGPGMMGTDAIVQRPPERGELRVPQAVMPGNYKVLDQDGRDLIATFSLNVPAEESDLSRVPAEDIEALLGANALLPLDHKTKLADALKKHWSQPLELFPWLMILLLLVLAVENLLANKFYRREGPEAQEMTNAEGRMTKE